MRFLLLTLLLFTCLLALPASAQQRPLVVRLDSGMVVTRPLVGIDTAAYTSIRVTQALNQAALALRARRILGLKAIIASDSADNLKQAAELAATRHDVAQLRQDVVAEQQRTQKALALPVQKPFFLDPNTYKGGLVALVAATLIKVFVFPSKSN